MSAWRARPRRSGGTGRPSRDQQVLLDQPILRDLERMRRREGRRPRSARKSAVADGHVLELVGDHVDRRRQTPRARPRRHRARPCARPRPRRPGSSGRGSRRGRRGRARRRRGRACGRADHRRGCRRSCPGGPAAGHSSFDGRSSTAADCAIRQPSRRLAISSLKRASTAAARSAALMAPERPMASVPTGTPAASGRSRGGCPARRAPSIRPERRRPAAASAPRTCREGAPHRRRRR